MTIHWLRHEKYSSKFSAERFQGHCFGQPLGAGLDEIAQKPQALRPVIDQRFKAFR